MKRILVPTDFSKRANDALNFAKEIALDNEATVILLHAVEYPVGATMDPIGVSVVANVDREMIDTLTTTAKEKMAVIKREFQNDGINIETIVDVGTAYISIYENIKNQHVDMVIMGSHGASGFKEMFIGSNAEKVVRHVKCPVITIKGPTHKRDI